MFFKTKRKKQIDTFNQLRLLCSKRNVNFFDVIINCPFYAESYLPEGYELILDDQWKGEDSYLNKVVGISPHFKNESELVLVFNSVFRFHHDYSIQHTSNRGWSVSKNPPSDSFHQYEELRKVNRRLVGQFSSLDKEGKLTDMINDLYHNWEYFESKGTYKQLLRLVNDLMSAYIDEDYDRVAMIWDEVQGTMKSLSAARSPDSIQQLKEALQDL